MNDNSTDNIPSFTYKNTRIGIISSVIGVILVLVSIVVFTINPNKPSENIIGGQSFPATLPAIASGCGDIFRIPPVEGNFGVIPDKYWEINAEATESSIPVSPLLIVPIFGYMAKTGLPADAVKFYTEKDFEDNPVKQTELLRSMYDNPDLLVIWYTKDADPADLTWLKNYANQENPGTVIVLPWELFSQKPMITGRNFAYAQWGISQTCSLLSEDVINEFREFTKTNIVPRPDTIPDAPMTNEGVLLPIGPSIPKEPK